jgi:hypothetical protein
MVILGRFWPQLMRTAAIFSADLIQEYMDGQETEKPQNKSTFFREFSTGKPSGMEKSGLNPEIRM